MENRSPRALKAEALDTLAAAPDHRRLALIWAGVSAVISLLVTSISFLLDAKIAETGGLSGIGLQSALSTAQSALSLLAGIFTPFWTLGYTGAILRLSRKQSATPASLLGGFSRFWTATRMLLLRYFFYLGVVIIGFYAGIMLLGMTPLSEPIYAFLDENQNLLMTGMLDDATAEELLRTMVPMMIGCSILALLVLIPVSYRFRMADFLIMDDPACGARAALKGSMRMMHRRGLKLLALDLSFWWYYLAQILLTALCYGDLILPALGINLPISADASFFLFCVLALAAQTALFYCFSNYVQTTYAAFYNDALPREEPQSIMPA